MLDNDNILRVIHVYSHSNGVINYIRYFIVVFQSTAAVKWPKSERRKVKILEM